MNANQPAYPTYNLMHSGLTKRELIAAMALQGFISNTRWNYDECAEEVLKYTDALLAKLQETAPK